MVPIVVRIGTASRSVGIEENRNTFILFNVILVSNPTGAIVPSPVSKRKLRTILRVRRQWDPCCLIFWRSYDILTCCIR